MRLDPTQCDRAWLRTQRPSPHRAPGSIAPQQVQCVDPSNDLSYKWLGVQREIALSMTWAILHSFMRFPLI